MLQNSSLLTRINPETELNQQLLLPITLKNVAQTLNYLELGADIEARDEDGDTPLCIAIIEGYFDTINILIERGADINVINEHGESPLFQAAAQGSMDIAIKLLENGANINGKNIKNTSIKELIKQMWLLENNIGTTPLMANLETGGLGLTEQLLQLGASIDEPNSKGLTPFLHMCIYGKPQSVRKFFCYIDGLDNESIMKNYIDHFKDPSIREFFSYIIDDLNDNCITIALLKSYFVNQQDHYGANALHLVIISKKSPLEKHALVKLLLPFANIDAHDINGETPYYISLTLQDKSPYIAKLLKQQRKIIDEKILKLLNKHKDITQQAKTRNSQMHTEEGNGNSDAINIRTFINNQLINTIISGDLYEAINLLRRGATIEAEDREGNTPLLLAIKYGHRNLVAALLSFGANIQKRNKEHINPLEACILNQDLIITKLILNKIAEQGISSCLIDQEEIILKVINKIHVNQEYYLEVLKMLLESGFSANAASLYNREVALCQAAKIGCLPAIGLLLNHNAVVDQKDGLGGSALFYASMLEDISVAKLLLQHGAEINEALLHAAATDNIDSTNKLIELRAEINGYDINNTPRQELIYSMIEQRKPRENLGSSIEDINPTPEDMEIDQEENSSKSLRFSL